MQDILKTIIEGIVIFLFIFAIYIITFKLFKWKSNLIISVIMRTRILVYLSIITGALWWISFHLSGYIYVYQLSHVLGFLLLFLITSIIIQISSSIIFDYYFIHKRNIFLPVIYRQLFVGILYVIFIFILMGSVGGVNIGHLLTTSAILSVVVGLALQDTLGNLFSGIALNIAKPYEIGDWVELDKQVGKIVKIDWRSTVILTPEGNQLIYPNSHIAKIQILNFTSPNKLTRREIEVGTHYSHPPAIVRKILIEAASDTGGVLAKPEPIAWLDKFNDSSINYKLEVWIDDFSMRDFIESDVKDKIWYKFKRENIKIPYPIRDVFIHEVKDEYFSIEDIVKLLKGIDFFVGIDDDELKLIASGVKVETFTKDEVIFCQGDIGGEFYFIKSGEVLIEAVNEKGEIYISKTLFTGNFFGEMAVLTGEKRTASVKAACDTVLIVIDKHNLEKIIKNENIAQTISCAIARRQQESLLKMDLHDEASKEEAKIRAEQEVVSLGKNILSKIKIFFGY